MHHLVTDEGPDRGLLKGLHAGVNSALPFRGFRPGLGLLPDVHTATYIMQEGRGGGMGTFDLPESLPRSLDSWELLSRGQWVSDEGAQPGVVREAQTGHIWDKVSPPVQASGEPWPLI